MDPQLRQFVNLRREEIGSKLTHSTRDARATVRGFKRVSDASFKQQWRPQMK